MRRCLAGLIMSGLLGGCQPVPTPPSTPLATASPRSTPSPIEIRPRAEWTLLFYFAADNDLEEAQMANLEELTRLPLASDQEQKIRILALVDRSPLGPPNEGYSNRAVANLANWNGARLLEVSEDRLTVIDDWGNLNMADPQTLKRFLSLAQDKFPAERTALCLVDHGRAWVGLCSDDSASRSGDVLDLKELSQALEILRNPLDLLVLDACMMGSLEIYLGLAPFARFLVASQETLPARGLEYEQALKPLLTDSTFTGKQLGQRFLQAYRQSLQAEPDEFGRLQLALLDTGPAPALASTWQTYSQAATQATPSSWQALAQARAEARSFRTESEPRMGGEVHDLGSLVDWTSRKVPSLQALAPPVRAQLKKVVVEQVHGQYRQESSGLSLFFPPLSEYLSEHPDRDYISLVDPLLPGWVAFLKQFTRLEKKAKNRPTLSGIDLKKQKARIDFEARVGDRKSLAQSYSILVKERRVVGQIPCTLAEESSWLRDFFDGQWVTLKDHNAEQGLLAQIASVDRVEADSRLALATLNCQHKRDRAGAWSEARLFFAIDPEDPQLKSRYLGAQRGSGGAWLDLRLQKGDELAFSQLDLQPGGHAHRGPSIKVGHPQHLSLSPQPVETGDYEIGFLIKDTRGGRHWQTRDFHWPE